MLKSRRYPKLYSLPTFRAIDTCRTHGDAADGLVCQAARSRATRSGTRTGWSPLQPTSPAWWTKTSKALTIRWANVRMTAVGRRCYLGIEEAHPRLRAAEEVESHVPHRAGADRIGGITVAVRPDVPPQPRCRAVPHHHPAFGAGARLREGKVVGKHATLALHEDVDPAAVERLDAVVPIPAPSAGMALPAFRAHAGDEIRRRSSEGSANGLNSAGNDSAL